MAKVRVDGVVIDLCPSVCHAKKHGLLNRQLMVQAGKLARPNTIGRLIAA